MVVHQNNPGLGARSVHGVFYRCGHGLYVVSDRKIYGRKHGIMDVNVAV